MPRRQPHPSRAGHEALLAGLVLLAGAAATAALWVGARVGADAELRARFDFIVQGAEARVLQRMLAYEQILRGVNGLYAASVSVERDEFHRYVAALRVSERYPGLQGLGYGQLVEGAGAAGLAKAMRAEGFPDFGIRPAGPRAVVAPVVFLEPLEGPNVRALGYDMLSEPVRRAALEQARDTGAPSLTAKVTLVIDPAEEAPAGAILYMPVYRNGAPTGTVEERRAALVGWTFAAFRMNDLMRGIFGELGDELAVRLFDGVAQDPAALMFDSRASGSPRLAEESRFAAARQLTVAGHLWTLEARSLPGLESRLLRERPRLVTLVGAAVSVALALMVWLLASARSRAVRESQRLAADLAERRRIAEELRGAERALRESEERLRLAMDSSRQVEWDLDGATGQLRVGDGWRQLTGQDPARVGDMAAWLEQVHPDDREAVRARREACMAGRTAAFEGEYRIRDAFGGWRWVRARGRVTDRDEAGRALRLVGTVTDIDEIHSLQEQLLAATRLASVGTMAAGVAHEINNPLSWIHTNLALGRERLAALGSDPASWPALRAELEELLGECATATSRIAAIVQAMRSLGRPERGEETRPLDVAAELLHAVQMVRNQVQQRARLILDVPDDLPRVRARTSELGRVFLNLLVNAAQAIPEGAPEDHTIAVSARRAGDGLVVEVRDSGTGIDPGVQARIFEPFFTTKAQGQGTGLGLPIARSIVVAAGGRIEVTSEPGRGAAFRVHLPAAEEGPDAAGPAPAVRSPAPARRRVLLVDDEASVARALSRWLSRHHEVTVLSSARDALQRLDAGERWDAMLVDLMMPGMDGVAFHEAVAERHPGLLAQLAFCSGGAFGDRATRFLAEHDVPVLPKPAELGDSLQLIERLARAGATPASPG